MPTLSNALQTSLLEWMRGQTFPTPPSRLMVGLLTRKPGNDGTNIAEPVGGYSRQPLTLSAATTADEMASVRNSAPVVFGPATGADWASISYMAVFGDNGQMLFQGPLATQRVAKVGDQIGFGANTIQLRIR